MSQLNYEQLGQVRQRRRRPAAEVQSGGGADRPAGAPPQTIRRFEVNLAIARSVGGANGPLVIDVAGTVVWCPKASADAACDVQLDGNDPVPFALHYNIQGAAFRRLQITNAAQVGKSLTLIVIDDQTNLVEVA